MLYGYAINVMGKSIEKIDCGCGLSSLSGVRNREQIRILVEATT